MKYRLRCMLFGHWWGRFYKEQVPIFKGSNATEWVRYYKPANNCWNCGLSKEEAGITGNTPKGDK